MKAKRSLSNSFDHLLKRKNSKDDIGIAQKEITKLLVPKVRAKNHIVWYSFCNQFNLLLLVYRRKDESPLPAVKVALKSPKQMKFQLHRDQGMVPWTFLDLHELMVIN